MEQYPQKLARPAPSESAPKHSDRASPAATTNHTHSPLSLRLAHDPAILSFPDAPTTELAPIQTQRERSESASAQSLPSLASLTQSLPATSEPQVTHWPSLNPLTAFYTPSYAKTPEAPARQDVEMSSASSDRGYDRRSASVSLDDPDVRMAAEALGDLRADFVSSPPNRSTPLPGTPRDIRMATSSPRDSAADQAVQEPLLRLITTKAPGGQILANTIEGAASVYNHGKTVSPQFRVGAEYIEDKLTPVARVMGHVGRRAGLEGKVRWVLGMNGGRKHQSGADLETGDRGHHKRRRAQLSVDQKESLDRSFPELAGHDRRESVSTIETLPAYDDARSPAYTETLEQSRQLASRSGSRGPTEWKTQIVVTTSGLGAAMRDESLRNLKFCLERLRIANSSVGNLLEHLQTIIRQYDAAQEQEGGEESAANNRGELVAKMNFLKTEIRVKIEGAIKMVSEYTASALPDNVRTFIHQQLIGLPSRLSAHAAREAAKETGPRKSTDQEAMIREGTNRVVVLAQEGLAMMKQVMDVLDMTIQSAEDWCQRMGKRKRDEASTWSASATDSKVPPPAQWVSPQTKLDTPATPDGDIHMVG